MESFKSLYKTKRHRFLAIANKITRDAQDAEDAVNEAFFILFRLDPRGIDNPAAYATNQVKWKALDILSKRKRNKEVSLEEPSSIPTNSSGVDRVAELEEEKFWDQCVNEGLIYLPSKEKRIIQIYCEADDYIRSIADEFDVHESNAKVMLRHARKHLDLLSKLAAIRRGRESLLRAIVEITLTGDCVYHELNWGLNRCAALKEPKGERDQSISRRLLSLIKLTQSIHFALRRSGTKKIADDNSKPNQFRKLIFQKLGEGSVLADRLTYKNEGATVRLTESVHKYLAKHGERIEIQVLRQEFRESHIKIQECISQEKAATNG